MTPNQLQYPALLLNFPATVDTRVLNNPWMTGTKFDLERAYAQWIALYKLLSQQAIVYLMPSYSSDYQDLPYVANVGCYLPHCDKMLVSNFKSEPRQGEEFLAWNFLHTLGYKVFRPRFNWEGEADLKRLEGNRYFGGYGIRTDFEALVWMQQEFAMDIICIPMSDPKLYHMDCLIFPIPNGNILAIKDTIPRLWHKMYNIITVPDEFKYDAWTNSLVLGKNWFYYLTTENPDSHEQLEKVIRSQGYNPVYVDISEFEKSGAALSCLIMHL